MGLLYWGGHDLPSRGLTCQSQEAAIAAMTNKVGPAAQGLAPQGEGEKARHPWGWK